MSHDDIRRSLEVLDSVLAEFDDCLDCWDSLPSFSNGKESNNIIFESQTSLGPRQLNLKKENGHISFANISHENLSTDSSTSQNDPLSEQAKVSSPPPIPKRSPTTKLSGDRNSGLFVFPADSSSLDSYDSARSDSSPQETRSSQLPRASTPNDGRPDDAEACARCGQEFVDNLADEGKDSLSPFMQRRKMFEDGDSSALQDKYSLSPFTQRRKMFEDKIAETKSPVLDRYRHASLKVRKVENQYDIPEPSSLRYSMSPESGFGSDDSPSVSSRDRLRPPKVVKVSPPSVDFSVLSTVNHAANCNCRERVRQLDLKFAETRRLLKANKIKHLNHKPPSFVPPPPPSVAVRNIRNVIESFNEDEKENFSKATRLEISRSQSFDSLQTVKNSQYSTNAVLATQKSCKVLNEEQSTSHSQSTSFPRSFVSDAASLMETANLCKKCSRSVPIPMSETIEDLPGLLPTDALNRPQLGLSYSMEDDLSPGVKEISQTSASRSEFSGSKDASSLSTFSLSASSLGYVSSQSDLELNNALVEPDKVPVVSLKSQTLPIGMTLSPSPFYSGLAPASDHNDNLLYRDQNLNHSSSSSDLQLRSSSAPPLPETKKHFRGFSKKDKKKNEDNLSVKSDLSLDEGIILKKIEALDGGTHPILDAVDSSEAGVEKKRWSMWRSILKKK